MRILIGLAMLVVGLALCLVDRLTDALARARSIKVYQQQLAATPVQETYTRAEYTSAAWQAWTNRVRVPAKAAFTAEELKDALFGLGSHQTSCDRRTLEGLIADASGYPRERAGRTGTVVPGVLAMLVGSFLLGGSRWPQKSRSTSLPCPGMPASETDLPKGRPGTTE